MRWHDIKNFLLFTCCLLIAGILPAAQRNIDFVVAYKDVKFAGVTQRAIAINGQIPGPEIHLQEGDNVVINVRNSLDVGTSIHWHGVLVPWQMDGVDGVSQQAIAPGESFAYKFSVQQAGTYWYHAHSGLQEQEGLYGALLIDPKEKPKYKYDKDFVIVLSDWSKTSADTIMQNLQSNGMYYSMRHNLHEFNDIAYDAFLLNGRNKQQPWTAQVKTGDVVRLRFIGAGASTMFRVKIPGVTMQTVHVQGNDVKPYNCADFVIAPGETQDVLITIRDDKQQYIIYAESLDQVGAAYGALITNTNSVVNYADVQPFTYETVLDLNKKYQFVTAAVPTNDPHKPVSTTINMNLTGNMMHYAWSINGKPGDQVPPMKIEQNRRYRIVFTNSTMMAHPMHVHGHWFILRKGLNEFDPLLHTILVVPNSTVNVDVDTDASGQWIFHCHLLYHMQAGMFRVLQYSSLPEIVAGTAQPQDIVKSTNFINRPIVRVDELMPIDPALVEKPAPM